MICKMHCVCQVWAGLPPADILYLPNNGRWWWSSWGGPPWKFVGQWKPPLEIPAPGVYATSFQRGPKTEHPLARASPSPPRRGYPASSRQTHPSSASPRAGTGSLGASRAWSTSACMHYPSLILFHQEVACWIDVVEKDRGRGDWFFPILLLRAAGCWYTSTSR
jgi:hypothetical protein